MITGKDNMNDHYVPSSRQLVVMNKCQRGLFSVASFSAIGDEDTDYCMRVLFSNETDYRFESYLQRGCWLFAQRLLAKYQRAWNVKTVLDLVATEFHSNLRLVLKRRKRQNGGKLHCREVDCVKLSAEIYFFRCVGINVLSVLRGCLSEEESELNRERHAAEKLSPQDIGVNPTLFESIPAARKVLARMTKPKSPHSRLLCLRRTIMALNATSNDLRPNTNNGNNNNNNSSRLLSSDDLLPALVYLVLKSTSVTDWTSNLVYMSDFHFSKASGDELGYCLASFEAATQYIRNKSLRKIAVTAQLPKRNLNAVDFLMTRSMLQDDDGPGGESGCAQSIEESGSLKEYVLALIETNDEAGLSDFYHQQEAMNNILSQRDVSSLLCHPLCDCPSCRMKREDAPAEYGENVVVDVNTALFQGKTALHVASLLFKSSILGTLCKNGAIVNILDEENMTPLHLACRVGSQSCVMLLLHLGARIDICDRDGNSPLHTASYFGFVDHIRGSKMKVNLVNDAGDTALHLAVKYQHSTLHIYFCFYRLLAGYARTRYIFTLWFELKQT